jgi:hypothetical protein
MRQVHDPARDEVHDVPLALDPTLDAEHAGREYDPALGLEELDTHINLSVFVGS